MKTTLYLTYLLFILIPGLLLLYDTFRVRKMVSSGSGILLIIGGILIVIHLGLSTGVYFLSLFGDVQSLSEYSIINAWLSGGTQFLGLMFLAIGLLLIKPAQVQK